MFDDLSARHERLKHRIHNFKIPLSRKGQIAMNVVYFVTPVVSGMYLMEWIHGRAENNLRRGGVLPEDYGEPDAEESIKSKPIAHEKELEKLIKNMTGGGQ